MAQQTPTPTRPPILAGKKALIVGVANDRSIAWGCAEAMHRSGAEIAMTYLNDKARPYVQPLASAVEYAMSYALGDSPNTHGARPSEEALCVAAATLATLWLH
jgi:enoyl-[acyl-carrier-protein] reductase (NADH)